MTGWAIGNRAVCAALMIAGSVLLALRLPPRVARVLWLVLLLAGAANGLALNLQSANLINLNLVHHYLGAKYSFDYSDFYKLVQAALGRPPVGIRDLDRPASLLNTGPRAERDYYIRLLRGARVSFDPTAPTDQLARRARESGAIEAEGERLLHRHLPPERADEFRSDVRRAVAGLKRGVLTLDYGFNGSPFYALVRRIDPTIHRPFGPAVAWFSMGWQILAALLLAWVVGRALDLRGHERLAAAALLFASWDFVGYALPGLVFGELWLPVALGALALRHRRAAMAGVAVAWAGLVKLFPFVLLLPAVVQAPRALTRARATTPEASWPWRMVAACGLATLVLGALATLSGRSWLDFIKKILVEFQSGFVLVNSVSRSAGLLTLGVHDSPLTPMLSLAAVIVLAAMFAGSGDAPLRSSLPLRWLVLIGAMGWVVHNWLNYYALVPLLLLPYHARDHRVFASCAALGMAVAFLMPEFDDRLLLSHPVLHGVKLVPYLLIPAWLVWLELRQTSYPLAIRRAAAWAGILVVLATAGEVWRMQEKGRLSRSGSERLDAGDAAGALERYQGLVRLGPRDGSARMNRAIALATLGRMDEAAKDFARAAQLAPKNAAAQANYGRVLMMEARLEAAAQRFETARALSPLDVGIMMDLVRLRLAQGRRSDAAALLARVLELEPQHPGLAELRRELEGS
jgi:tetratricopeptide repeat protein